MKVLIVDDQAANRIMPRVLLESEGHECIEAEDGNKAIEKFQACAPDCILMDIVMPNMDGFEAATKIKELSSGYHVPIIFLTAKTDEASILKCLESGGDDYLPKPVNQVMLMAKIRAHARTQELTEQIRAKNEELTLLHATLQQEHEMGKHVLSHTLQRNWQDCPNVRSYLSAVSIFNGDIFLVARKPTGGLYALLADLTGHGLAAAIGTIPLSQVFFAMCRKGKALMDIAAAMNTSLKAFLPEYMFCAATLIDMSESGETMTVWAGGLPDAPIIRAGEGVVEKVISKHMPLGILSADEFDNAVQVFNLKAGDRVLLMTDGILEGVNESGEMFGSTRLFSSISHGQENYFERLLGDYKAFSGKIGQQDDISLAEIRAEHVAGHESTALEQNAWLPWSVSVRLEAEQLRVLSDPVLQLIKFFPEDMLFSQHIDVIRTILAELYSNALEHGLLGLNSELKSTADGFMEYYHLRERHLATLEEGFINIDICYDATAIGRELTVTFEDSGKGFDSELFLQRYSTDSLELNDQEWGRGLPLIASLSKSLSFDLSGRRVTVEFELN